MAPIVEIAGYFNNVVLGSTPLQRWEALKNYEHDPAGHPWLNAVGILVIVLLAALFYVNRLNRIKREKGSSGQLFSESARSKDLTDHEHRLLLDIANNEALKRIELIFTLPSAFDRGAAHLVEDALAEQGIEQSRQLQAELSFLREKLGFRKPPLPDTAPAIDPGGLSSRQIPAKKKIFIRLPKASVASDDLEATVIENTADELRVEFSTPVEVVFGQSWRCRYYSGAFAGEFETTVSRCSGVVVALNHSDHIRLINRRKFLRVPINGSAYVASFPLMKTLAGKDTVRRKKNAAVEAAPNTLLEPPVFFPATVTELGGPGLRIDTHLEVVTGDRVLLVFKLNDPAAKDSTFAGISSKGIVEDIAKVRHIVAKEEGFSIALELTGLSDEGIEMLVRAANEAALSRTKMTSNDPASGIRERRVPEPLCV